MRAKECPCIVSQVKIDKGDNYYYKENERWHEKIGEEFYGGAKGMC